MPPTKKKAAPKKSSSAQRKARIGAAKKARPALNKPCCSS